MTMPPLDPCATEGICEPWATLDDFCGPAVTDFLSEPCSYDNGAIILQNALNIAMQTVFNKTLRKYTGCCLGTYYLCRTCEPCATPSGCGSTYNGFSHPEIIDGIIYNCKSSCGSCRKQNKYCWCDNYDTVEIPIPYFHSIFEVWDNGVLLDPSAYKIINGNVLVRIDGQNFSGECSDVAKEYNEVGSGVVIRAYAGLRPPEDLVDAMLEYAYQIALRCVNEKRCKLPERFTIKEGIPFYDQNHWVKDGLTGWDKLDALIIWYNPKLRRGPRQIVNPIRETELGYYTKN